MNRVLLLAIAGLLAVSGCDKNDNVMMQINTEIPGTEYKAHLEKRGGDATVGYSYHISVIPKSLVGYEGNGNVVICDRSEDLAINVQVKELIIYHPASARFFKSEKSLNGITITYKQK